MVAQIPAKGKWRVDAVSFSPDGKLAAIGGSALEIFDLQTKSVSHSYDVDGVVYALAFSGDNRYLAASINDVAKQIEMVDGQMKKVGQPQTPVMV